MLPERLWGEAATTQEARRLQSPIELCLTNLLEDIEVGFIPHDEVRAAVGMKAGQGLARILASRKSFVRRDRWSQL
jgi:hypothetical protein